MQHVRIKSDKGNGTVLTLEVVICLICLKYLFPVILHLYSDMTGHQQYTHQRAASLINKKQIKNEWHCFQTSCQESHNKLKRLNQTTLSCSVFFFLPTKKISKHHQRSCSLSSFGVKQQGEEAKENSPVTARGLYVHLAEDITCTFIKLNCSCLTAKTRCAFTLTRKLPLVGFFDVI